MKKLGLGFVALALLAPAVAGAQVTVRFNLGLPPVPPLVYVQPEVQVVEDYDDEVFFHNGFYWARRDNHWFRSSQPHAEFVYVEPGFVPAPLLGIEVGRYRHFRHEMRMEERERLRREENRREEIRREEWQRHHEAEWREQERRRAEEHRRWEDERRHEQEMREHERREEHREARHEERHEERHEARHDERREDAHHGVEHQATPAPAHAVVPVHPVVPAKPPAKKHGEHDPHGGH